MTEELLKLLLEIRDAIRNGYGPHCVGWESIGTRIDDILDRGPRQNFPWYMVHQWGQDQDYQWYQSCSCRRCMTRTEEIAAEQS